MSSNIEHGQNRQGYVLTSLNFDPAQQKVSADFLISDDAKSRVTAQPERVSVLVTATKKTVFGKVDKPDLRMKFNFISNANSWNNQSLIQPQPVAYEVSKHEQNTEYVYKYDIEKWPYYEHLRRRVNVRNRMSKKNKTILSISVLFILIGTAIGVFCHFKGCKMKKQK